MKRQYRMAVFLLVMFVCFLPVSAQQNLEKKQARTDFFLPGEMPGALSSKLDLLGNRWKRSGRERITYALSLQLKERGQDKNEQALLTVELPNRLSLERPGNRKTGHDGEESWRTGASAPDDDDSAILETIAFDSVESLFENARRGVAFQFLGSRYNLDGGRSASSGGPRYDVFLASIPVRKGKQIEFSNKLFFFNSDTGLLEIVRYSGARGAGLKGQVETKFEWQKIDNDYVLRSFRRTESGQVVAEATVSSVTIAAKTQDEKFKP